MNILFIHGIFVTGNIFRLLEEELTKQGHRCLAPSLTPRDGRHGIADLAQKLDFLVHERFGPNEPLVIIGFSMGCIVARYYMYRLGGMHRTAAFFAISGPHRGSLLAYFYPGKGARDLRPGSALLRELDSVDHSDSSIPIYSYWTPLDLMIIPASSSRWAPARETIIWSPLHPLMPSHGRLRADIIGKIEELDDV